MRVSLPAPVLAVALLLAACGSPAPGADLPDGGDGARDAADAADPAPEVPDAPSPDAPPADADAFEPGPSKRKAALFDPDTVPLFALSFAPADWQQFLAYRQQGLKEYVPCTFTHDGESFFGAACRSKSNPAYWPEEKKPQFLVRFNRTDKAGRFRGLRALVLEASAFHSAPLRDRAGMWLFRQAGLPASLVNHVRLQVDGADYGVYMNVENVDREFLEDRFPDPTGNLFENGYELITNEDTEPEDLWDLNDRVEAEPLEGDHAAFFAALEGILDVPQVLRFMAAEAAFPTGDNFTNGGSNFLWYHDPAAGFVLIPWDLDDVLSEWGRPDADPFAYWGEPEVGLPPCKLCQWIHRNPAWSAEFVRNLVEFRDSLLPLLKAEVQALCQQVRPLVQADPYPPSSDIDDFDADCADMADRVDRRMAFLRVAFP